MMHKLPESMHANGRRTAVLMVALALTVSACTTESHASAGASSGASASSAATASTATAQPASAAPAAAVTAGQFTLTDFATLRFLNGSWRGRLPDGTYFYERYRIVDDSTIAMQGFSDSTFKTASDSSRITLRGTTIASEGATSRWEATRLDPTGVEFASTRNPGNGFAWHSESANLWTATIKSRGADGKTNTTDYRMERVGK